MQISYLVLLNTIQIRQISKNKYFRGYKHENNNSKQNCRVGMVPATWGILWVKRYLQDWPSAAESESYYSYYIVRIRESLRKQHYISPDLGELINLI